MQQIDIEHFSLTTQQLDSLIGEALGQGGQWADLYFEDSNFRDSPWKSMNGKPLRRM